eukprot:385693-Heterocapsa_arctica.AAC.1
MAPDATRAPERLARGTAHGAAAHRAARPALGAGPPFPGAQGRPTHRRLLRVRAQRNEHELRDRGPRRHRLR